MRGVPAELMLALAVTVMLSGAAFGQAVLPAPQASDNLALLKKPIVFYVARGEPDACGPGCNEWIAAEGALDAGAPARFRAFLAKTRAGKLPVYIHSPGGLDTPAFNIGRLIRERGLTVGVSKTLPERCKTLDEQACDDIKRSGDTLTAELSPLGGCNSACVYLLAAGKVRQVPPGAQVGVHMALLVRMHAEGRITAAAKVTKAQIHEREVRERNYFREMGIDQHIVEIASKTPHQSIHLLSRDEIMSLGIDKREFQETRWLVNPKTYSVTKLFVEAKGPDRREFRTSSINLSCRSGKNVGLLYIRGLASGESGAKPYLRLEFANRKIVLEGPICRNGPMASILVMRSTTGSACNPSIFSTRSRLRATSKSFLRTPPCPQIRRGEPPGYRPSACRKPSALCAKGAVARPSHRAQQHPSHDRLNLPNEP